MTATRPIRQPVRGRALRKLLLKRLHLPRAVVHPLLRAAKRAASPTQHRVREELAAGLAEDGLAAARIEVDRGFVELAPAALPGSAAAIARCRALFEERREALATEALRFNPRKGYLLALLRGSDFWQELELVRFLVSRPVLDSATAYLGTVPILAGAALWWTPANESLERSQLYHFDGEDERQVKLLLNVTETGPDQGPFTVMPADRSAPLRDARAMRRRISDAEVDAACGQGHAVAFQGPPGSGGFVDTSRCLHFGSRGARRDRVVLMAQFLRFDCPTESTFSLGVPPGLGGLDAFQQLALGLEALPA